VVAAADGEGRRRGTAPAPRWRCSARNR